MGEEDAIYRAVESLNGEQLYVMAAVINGCTADQIAREMTENRGVIYSADRVSRIKRTALAKMRRVLGVLS